MGQCEAEFLSDGRVLVRTKLVGRYTVQVRASERGIGWGSGTERGKDSWPGLVRLLVGVFSWLLLASRVNNSVKLHVWRRLIRGWNVKVFVE